MNAESTRVHTYCAQHYGPKEANQVLYHLGEGGYPAGSFVSALIDAMFKADPDNFELLSDAFPRWAAAITDYRLGGGVVALRAKALG